MQRAYDVIRGAADAFDELGKAFQKTGIRESDAAKKFAAEMLNKPYDQVTPEERKEAKNHPLFFLKMYGSHPPKP